MKSINKLCILFLLTGLFQLSCQKEITCPDCLENIPPISIAGPDQVTILPTDSILLDGSLSKDPDGRIMVWLWTKISGPASAAIIHPSDSITTVKNLIAGNYLFELKVADDENLSATDTMQIIVTDPSLANRPPVANAGIDTTIIIPISAFSLDGTGSIDPDNNIVSYNWTKISGPPLFNISDGNLAQTQVTDLELGTYLFELKVTDADGLYSKDTMQVSVIDPPIPTCGDSNRPHVSAQLIPIGTLSQARMGIAAASIGNKILFAGGLIDGNVLSSRVDIYDITTQSWSTAELSEARYIIPVIAVGNKIFFGGGEIGDGTWPVNTVDIYDAANNTWSVAKLSQVGHSMATAAVGNKVFFAGGDQGFAGTAGQNRSAIVDIYDLNTNTWSVAQLSEPRRLGISAVAANDKVYFAGGEAFSNNNWYASDKIDIYDNTSNSWSTSTLYEGKMGCGGISAGDKIYWAGGLTGNNLTLKPSCLIEIKDVNAGSSIAYLSNPGGGQSFIKDGKIVFLAGGNTFDIFDQTTGTWSIGVLPADIHISDFEVRISVNNTIYLAGVTVNGVVSNQVWKLEF